jgi:hypothetical protein
MSENESPFDAPELLGLILSSLSKKVNKMEDCFCGLTPTSRRGWTASAATDRANRAGRLGRATPPSCTATLERCTESSSSTTAYGNARDGGNTKSSTSWKGVKLKQDIPCSKFQAFLD